MSSILLEELQLIQCSLLPHETLTFSSNGEIWEKLLAGDVEDLSGAKGPFPLEFSVRIEGCLLSIDVEIENESLMCEPDVTVRGNMGREEQIRWREFVIEKKRQLEEEESQNVVYELLIHHLIPELNSNIAVLEPSHEAPGALPQHEPTYYHALLTSHHLLAPSKRRSLQGWASQLNLSGFAKVGHPGVIYAQGDQKDVEEFVDNIKALQWLALRVRFVEPDDRRTQDREWKEFQKVGEVVEEMKRIGREEFVLEMGIGSAGTSSSKA